VSSNSVKASANTNTITSSITKPDVKTPRKPSADDDVKKRKADHDFTMTKEPKKQKITPTRCTITIDQIVIGKTYPGNVTSTTPYGAFVNIGCGQDGLVHVSELRNGYVANVNSVVNVGDSVQVHNLHTRDNAKILPYKMLWHHVPYYDK
jgi:ribosomal protein S1